MCRCYSSPAVTQLLQVGSVPLGALQRHRDRHLARCKKFLLTCLKSAQCNPRCGVKETAGRFYKQQDEPSPGTRGQRWAWPCPSGPGSAASRCRWTLCTPWGCSSCAAPARCGSEGRAQNIIKPEKKKKKSHSRINQGESEVLWGIVQTCFDLEMMTESYLQAVESQRQIKNRKLLTIVPKIFYPEASQDNKITI